MSGHTLRLEEGKFSVIRNKEDESVQIDVVWRAYFLLMLGLYLIEKVSVPSLVLSEQTVTLRQK